MAAISLLVCLFWVTPVFSQAGDGDSAAGHEAVRDYENNMLNILIGVTSESRRDNGVTLGLEYERRLGRPFGVGVIAERAFGDLDFWVFVAPLFFHTGRWKFLIAPGVEDGDLGTEFLLRVGGDYAFKVGEWEIAPGADVDFVDGDQVLVVGLSIGRGF